MCNFSKQCKAVDGLICKWWVKRNCRFVYSGNLKRRGGLGAQWIISLSLTPELILVLVTETHLQDRTNCLSSQHAFLQAGPHFYRASSRYQMLSAKISAIQNYSSRRPNTSYSRQRQDVCVGLFWQPRVRIVVDPCQCFLGKNTGPQTWWVTYSYSASTYYLILWIGRGDNQSSSKLWITISNNNWMFPLKKTSLK